MKYEVKRNNHVTGTYIGRCAKGALTATTSLFFGPFGCAHPNKLCRMIKSCWATDEPAFPVSIHVKDTYSPHGSRQGGARLICNPLAGYKQSLDTVGLV